MGIGFWKGTATSPSFPNSVWERGTYLQEHIDGESCAAIYVGDGRRSLLLGLTRQLVGESWLHAAPFHYCGSIGLLQIEPPLRQALERLGDALVDSFGLRGIFGVDCIVRDDVPWPVEVNPRYTASVEVLEYAGNISALALHRQVFDCVAGAGLATLRRSVYDERFCEASLNPGLHDRPHLSPGHPPPFVGKAILFARAPFLFPQDGPWQAVLRGHVAVDEMPAFADIPHAGERIEAGRPILTLFASSGHGDCMLQSTSEYRGGRRQLAVWDIGYCSVPNPSTIGKVFPSIPGRKSCRHRFQEWTPTWKLPTSGQIFTTL